MNLRLLVTEENVNTQTKRQMIHNLYIDFKSRTPTFSFKKDHVLLDSCESYKLNTLE